MTTAHAEPNYMGVFWWLLALTVLEIAVIYMDVARLIIVILLVGMAVSKAALVGLYFMHLKFEKSTLGMIALTPMVICVFLIFMLLPDLTAHNKTYQPSEQAAVSESGASH